MEIVMVITIVSLALFAVVVCIVLYLLHRKTSATGMTASVGNVSTTQCGDMNAFSEKFVSANIALSRGDTDALKEGIALFIEGLPHAGNFRGNLISAIQALYGALSHHDRADKKGPWNRDLSGYGVIAWQNDLYDRNTALRRAWKHISLINEGLKKKGLGWNY